MSFCYLSHWFRKRPFRYPPCSQSCDQHRITDPCTIRPLCQRLRNTIQSDQTVVPPIVVLLLACGPSDIPRFISFVIVNSINGIVEAGTWTNVGTKRRIRTSPFLTNSYSSSSVQGKPVISGSYATSLHLAPRFIFRVFVPTPSATMCRVRYSGAFSHVTPARLRVLAGQFPCGHDDNSAARTLTTPCRAPLCPVQNTWSRTKNRQITKGLSRQITRLMHDAPPPGVLKMRGMSSEVLNVGSDPSRLRTIPQVWERRQISHGVS